MLGSNSMMKVVLLRRRVEGKKGDKAPDLPTAFSFVNPLTFHWTMGLTSMNIGALIVLALARPFGRCLRWQADIVGGKQRLLVASRGCWWQAKVVGGKPRLLVAS